MPTYDEANEEDEESDDEEEKEKRLAEEEYFKEDMLGYVKFKKEQKKEEMNLEESFVNQNLEEN